MRTVQVGDPAIDRALREAAVWWYRFGVPAAEAAVCIVRANVSVQKRRLPRIRFWKRGVSGSGFPSAAHFLQSLEEKAKKAVGYARRP
jgi:hypothetical protein